MDSHRDTEVYELEFITNNKEGAKGLVAFLETGTGRKVVFVHRDCIGLMIEPGTYRVTLQHTQTVAFATPVQEPERPSVVLEFAEGADYGGGRTAARLPAPAGFVVVFPHASCEDRMKQTGWYKVWLEFNEGGTVFAHLVVDETLLDIARDALDDFREGLHNR